MRIPVEWLLLTNDAAYWLLLAALEVLMCGCLAMAGQFQRILAVSVTFRIIWETAAFKQVFNANKFYEEVHCKKPKSKMNLKSCEAAFGVFCTCSVARFAHLYLFFAIMLIYCLILIEIFVVWHFIKELWMFHLMKWVFWKNSEIFPPFLIYLSFCVIYSLITFQSLFSVCDICISDASDRFITVQFVGGFILCEIKMNLLDLSFWWLLLPL